MRQMTRSRIKTLLRYFVSFGLIGWLVAGLDLQELDDGLRRAELKWLLLAHLLTPAALAFSVWKWRLLLEAHGHSLSRRSLWGFYLLGKLASNFMPSNVGGDFIRVALASRALGPSSWPAVTGSILVERLTGLIGLFISLFAGAALHFQWVRQLDLLFPILAGALAILVACFLIFSRSSNRLLAWMGGWPLMERPVSLLMKLHDACLTYSRRPALLTGCIAISVLFYVLIAFQVWVLCWAFPWVEVSWTTQLVLFGIVALVSFLPISINGYGVQESVHVLLLMSLGFAQHEALIIALGYRAILLGPALVGALLFASSGFVRSIFHRSAATTGVS
ncbi:MAG: lysylphosphatidylglycerol synthase transmembrane domain-containing protein [Geminicoccaceae bacterium]